MNEQTETKETFETAYKRLDGIVNRMEKESLDLEEAELKLKDLRETENA